MYDNDTREEGAMPVIGSGSIQTSAYVTTEHWKPVSSAPVASGSAKTAGQTVDNLSMSKLGQALTGKTAEIFKHLDPKARSMLDEFVSSGKASTDDVARGLQQLAEYATFNRYVEETPNTAAEDQAFKNAYAKHPDPKEAYKVINQVAQGRKAAHDAYGSGEISHDQLRDQLREATSAFAASDAFKDSGEPGFTELFGDAAAAVLKRKEGEFLTQQRASGESTGDGIGSEEGYNAMMKLGELGFDQTVFKDAFVKYAQAADVPGLGPKAKAAAPETAPPTTPAPATAAASASPQPRSAENAKPESVKTDSAKADSTKATNDAGNAQAALSMLQSALAASAQKSGGIGGLGSGVLGSGGLGGSQGEGASTRDALANGLLEALKASAGKAKTNDAQTI